MELLKNSKLEEHRTQITASLKEVVELSEEQIERIQNLLTEGSMECWIQLRDTLCIGYAITHTIYDQPSDKNLLLVYMWKTLDTTTPAEVQRFYNDLMTEAKNKKCAALTFFSSFQNEKSYEVLRKYGAIVRVHFYVPTGEV